MILRRLTREGCAPFARTKGSVLAWPSLQQRCMGGRNSRSIQFEDEEDVSEFAADVLLGDRDDPQHGRASREFSGFADIPLAPEHEEFLSLVDSITTENRQSSSLRMGQPSIPSRTFGIALPPKWAAEVPRRLSRQGCMLPRSHTSAEVEIPMPLSSRKVYLFQQAFIHPSFVRVDKTASDVPRRKDDGTSSPDTVANVALRFTNYPLTIMGHSLLRVAMMHWAVDADPNISAQALNEAIGQGGVLPILTDEGLSRIGSLHWGLDDLLLCDGKLYEGAIAKQKKAASMGGVVSTSSSLLSRPVSHVATIVPSICAAVYLAHGMDVAMQFIGGEVLPLLIKDVRGFMASTGLESDDSLSD